MTRVQPPLSTRGAFMFLVAICADYMNDASVEALKLYDMLSLLIALDLH